LNLGRPARLGSPSTRFRPDHSAAVPIRCRQLAAAPAQNGPARLHWAINDLNTVIGGTERVVAQRVAAWPG